MYPYDRCSCLAYVQDLGDESIRHEASRRRQSASGVLQRRITSRDERHAQVGFSRHDQNGGMNKYTSMLPCVNAMRVCTLHDMVYLSTCKKTLLHMELSRSNDRWQHPRSKAPRLDDHGAQYSDNGPTGPSWYLAPFSVGV